MLRVLKLLADVLQRKLVHSASELDCTCAFILFFVVIMSYTDLMSFFFFFLEINKGKKENRT